MEQAPQPASEVWPFFLIDCLIQFAPAPLCQQCKQQEASFAVDYYGDVERIRDTPAPLQGFVATQLQLQEIKDQRQGRLTRYMSNRQCEQCVLAALRRTIEESVIQGLLAEHSSLTAVPGAIIVGEAVLDEQGHCTSFISPCPAHLTIEEASAKLQRHQRNTFDLYP